MAFASVNTNSASLGVKVTEGEGSLPKVVLTSAEGRCVYPFVAFVPLPCFGANAVLGKL